jgi:hypothetical protein
MTHLTRSDVEFLTLALDEITHELNVKFAVVLWDDTAPVPIYITTSDGAEKLLSMLKTTVEIIAAGEAAGLGTFPPAGHA